MMGRVIDGPWEGRSYAAPVNGLKWFRVALAPPLMEVVHGPINPSIPCFVEGIYVWSYSLKAWVFRWDLLPKA